MISRDELETDIERQAFDILSNYNIKSINHYSYKYNKAILKDCLEIYLNEEYVELEVLNKLNYKVDGKSFYINADDTESLFLIIYLE